MIIFNIANLNRALASLSLSTLLIFACAGAASAQTTSFTYQGRLTDGGSPANGTYEIQFTLWDATAGGTQQPQPAPVTITRVNVQVTAGAFTVQPPLDFGAAAFPGADRYLEISVRRAALDPFTTLSPRQQITSTPYAIRSLTAATADTATSSTQLAGVDAARFVQSDAGGNVNIAGALTVGGSFSLNTVNAQTQYNLGGQRILGNAGNSNLFVGTGAGTSNSGAFNTFVGNLAGNSNTIGDANAFFGNTAGFKNTTGTSNSFFGAGAGVNNINGSSNAYFGTLTGFNSTASSNSFFGALAGQNNTTGSSNAFFGSSTGFSNISGQDNSFFGSLAGRNNLASNNTFFGSFTGFNNSTGTGNSFFGVNAATLNTVGSDNTIIGASANVGAGNLANANAFGAKAFVSTSNSIVLGSINGVNGALSNTNVGIGTTSPVARLHVVGSSWFQGDTTPLPASAGKGVIIGFSGEQGYISGFDYGTFTPKNLLLNLGGGNVGIGTTTPNSRLTVAGLIETTAGGVKFPDGSIQTTAGGGGGGGILNQTTQQVGANFNIDGTGAAKIFNATTQYNLGGQRFLSTTGTLDLFIGASAGHDITTGFQNTVVGGFAGLRTTTGKSNSFFGSLAGGGLGADGNVTGTGNSFFGFSSGSVNTTGDYNTSVGTLANLGANNLINATAIGANALVSTSNSMVLGSIDGVNGASANTNVGIGTTAPQTRLQIKTLSNNYGMTHTDGTTTVGSYVSASGGWLGTLSNHPVHFFINGGLPRMTVDTTGNVGIGISTPNSKLAVAGLIESTAGGIKFPDGTIQTTAGGGGGITGVTAGTGLSGGGTVGNVTIAIANLGIDTPLLANSAVTAPKIASGQVVKGLNGLNDNVTLAGGPNITITPSGNTLTIASTGAGGILNQTSQQAGANFNIDGIGTANIFSAEQFNLGFNRIIGSTTDSSGLLIGIAAGGLNNGGSGFGTTFVGTFAGESNINGGGNSFFGHSAGRRNTGGNNNSFFGTLAGRENTTGSGNSFFGFQAGVANTGGQYNSFIGVSSGGLNDNGQDNTFVGAGTGQANTNGNDNSFFGSRAGALNTSSYNSFFGKTAGLQTTSGGGNVFVGWQAGFENVTGSNNTVLGFNAGAAIGSNNLNDSTAIGANALVTQSNSLVLGSVNGVNGGVDTKVGIGTTAPKAKLDVTGGNILVGTPGQGIILKSPDGATCRLLSIDNAGNLVTAVTPCL
jgi:hypothetical protein